MHVRMSSIRESRFKYASRIRVSLVRTWRRTVSASTLATQIKTSKAPKPMVSSRPVRASKCSGERHVSLVYRTCGASKYRPQGIVRRAAMRSHSNVRFRPSRKAMDWKGPAIGNARRNSEQKGKTTMKSSVLAGIGMLGVILLNAGCHKAVPVAAKPAAPVQAPVQASPAPAPVQTPPARLPPSPSPPRPSSAPPK